MKARVKATNEIVDVVNLDPITEQDIAPCDLWEQRRWEAAKDCLVGIIANARFNIDLDINYYAEQAVSYADTLINELKQE